LFADRGYDYDKYRRLLRARGIAPKARASRGGGADVHEMPRTKKTTAKKQPAKKTAARKTAGRKPRRSA
jgi:DNA end-binding protein Ku